MAGVRGKTLKMCPSKSAKHNASLLAECWGLPRPGCVSDSAHRQRNAADTHHCVGRGRGMQAARLRTLSPMNTARGLEPWGKAGASRAHSPTSLTTSICDIIPIFSGQCWFGPAWLCKHWVSCWRAPERLSQNLSEIRHKMAGWSAEWIFFCFKQTPLMNRWVLHYL